MHETKTAWFDSSAVFESFCYKKLAENRAANYGIYANFRES